MENSSRRSGTSPSMRSYSWFILSFVLILTISHVTDFTASELRVQAADAMTLSAMLLRFVFLLGMFQVVGHVPELSSPMLIDGRHIFSESELLRNAISSSMFYTRYVNDPETIPKCFFFFEASIRYILQ